MLFPHPSVIIISPVPGLSWQAIGKKWWVIVKKKVFVPLRAWCLVPEFLLARMALSHLRGEKNEKGDICEGCWVFYINKWVTIGIADRSKKLPKPLLFYYSIKKQHSQVFLCTVSHFFLSLKERDTLSFLLPRLLKNIWLSNANLMILTLACWTGSKS